MEVMAVNIHLRTYSGTKMADRPGTTEIKSISVTRDSLQPIAEASEASSQSGLYPSAFSSLTIEASSRVVLRAGFVAEIHPLM